MKLSRPASPFERVELHGGSFTLDTSGKVLVLPSGDPDVLPSFNEYVLNSNRLTIAESPFGGLKGSGSPDYAPGTLNVISGDGVYLQDTSGTNSTKTLTAGKLKELSLLTVDTVGHSITEEFQVANTAESNNPTVIDDCSNATGWSITAGSGSISSDGTQISINGTTDATGNLYAEKTLSAIDATNFHFLALQFTSSKTGTCYTSFGASENRVILTKSVIENNISNMVWAYKSPATPAESTPYSIIGTPAWNAVSYIRIGYTGQPNTQVIFSCGAISIDSVKSAYIELQTPNNLSATSTIVQCWGGSAYAECRRDSIDGAYSNVSSTPENMKMLDGTKFDDVYGSGFGRAYFPKGVSGETKAGSSGNITYSANKGTRNRIGFRIDLPPSDGGRTNFNKVRLKITTYYTDTVGNIVPDLSGNNNTGTIVGGVTKLNDGGLQFDSSGQVHIGKVNALRVSQSFTITAIIKPTLIAGDLRTIYSSGYSNMYKKGIWLHINPDDNKIHCAIGNGTIREDKAFNSTVNLGVIYKIVYTYDGVTAKLYINGNLDGTSTGVTGDIIYHTNSYDKIGVRDETTTLARYFYGDILSESFYNRVFSQEEATAYSNGQSVSTTGLVLHYNPTVQNMGSTTHDFADSTNASYGLQNLSLPWIALYDPAGSIIDFYRFTHRPKNLSFKRNEAGIIHELSLYPGNGQIYHGQITYAGLTTDTDSDTIPDCLEADINGSVTKFLEHYRMET